MKQFTKDNLEPEWIPVVEEFPKIFLEKSDHINQWTKDEPQENVVNLRFGFEHGLGWKEIVRGFCKDVQDLADKAEANGDTFQYKGCIMKEKFGRFTPQGDIDTSEGAWEKYREEYYDICNKWESKSYTVCEVCGEPGTLTGKAWVKTVCKEHERKDI